MCGHHRRLFIGGVAGVLGSLALLDRAASAQSSDKAKVYICPPCGCPNDDKEFAAPGRCMACDMPLMEKPSASAAGADASTPQPPLQASPAATPSHAPKPAPGARAPE